MGHQAMKYGALAAIASHFDLVQGERMKLLIGLVVSFAVGVFCRVFDVPVGSPPVIPGALLVLAMTLGYTSANSYLNRRNKPATTSHLCGGPTGATVAKANPVASHRPTPTQSSSSEE
jgi:XapX domain-containing protein